ncbi:type VI immunity family protein [Sorangium sp. So ce406]|uniref:type VI immunity family protein n=1 Tax=Sorangium sp. So ce406 TaxID=3133311 RepID=UPI003F5C404C
MTSAAPPPLCTSGATPVLHGVLGAVFHLEALLPEDEARLEQVHLKVLDWMGGELRWTLNSRIGQEEPFEPADLAFASAYPASLAVVPHGQIQDPEAFRLALEFNVRRRADMGLACHGAARRLWASPWSYRFYAEIVGSDDTPQLIAPAVLRLTVPSTWPLDDFARRTLEIAALLRLRWGAAGLTYSAWETQLHAEAMQAIYAHARRHPGYDVGLYVAWMEELHDRLRTVNWLTLLGRGLQDELAQARGRLPESDDLVTTFRAGEHLVLRAGPQPEAGDHNRLRIPPAYVRADEMVRPVRAAEGLNFYEAWTESTTTQWLRRFEKRLF